MVKNGKKWLSVEVTKEVADRFIPILKLKGIKFDSCACYCNILVQVYVNDEETQLLDDILDKIYKEV